MLDAQLSLSEFAGAPFLLAGCGPLGALASVVHVQHQWDSEGLWLPSFFRKTNMQQLLMLKMFRCILTCFNMF